MSDPETKAASTRASGSPRTVHQTEAELLAAKTADLGGLRSLVFQALQSADIPRFRERLASYGVLLERLAKDAASDPVTLLRLRTDHGTFFEQIKATLVTNRIRLRLELERVKASRQYGGEPPRHLATTGWEG